MHNDSVTLTLPLPVEDRTPEKQELKVELPFFRHGDWEEAVIPMHEIQSLIEQGVNAPLTLERGGNGEVESVRISEELVMALAASILRVKLASRVEAMTEAQLLDQLVVSIPALEGSR